jgi:hypothetical protein
MLQIATNQTELNLPNPGFQSFSLGFFFSSKLERLHSESSCKAFYVHIQVGRAVVHKRSHTSKTVKSTRSGKRTRTGNEALAITKAMGVTPMVSIRLGPDHVEDPVGHTSAFSKVWGCGSVYSTRYDC